MRREQFVPMLMISQMVIRRREERYRSQRKSVVTHVHVGKGSIQTYSWG